MTPETLKRLMADRSLAAFLEQRRNERRSGGGSQLGVAIALVISRRVDGDWAWLDQDRALHRP